MKITRQRGGGAVLMSEEEWASIEETMYLLRSPANARRLLEAVRGFEADDWRAAKLIALVEECRRHPFKGAGKPEPLSGNLSGCWSRRISQEHRMVSCVAGGGAEQTLQLAQCWHHY